MGSRRPQTRRTGNKNGNKDEKGQKKITDFTVKKTRDAVQKPAAKKTSVGGRALPTRLSNQVLDKLHDLIQEDDSDEGEPAQGRDPLEGAKARFPIQKKSNRGGSATKKPLDLLQKVIEHPDNLVEDRRRQGRIELGSAAAEPVDRLYEGIKAARHSKLCEVDPLYEELELDATPCNYLASIHNLYLDLRDHERLHKDDLLCGLRLALLGRDDVFLSPLELGFVEGEDSPFDGIEDFDWKQRRFHVVLFFHDNNHFAVIIGDRKQGKALYYNMIPFSDDLFDNVKTRYARFLDAIDAPQVALSRGKGPEQTDSNSCGLLALEAVRHVFREHSGDIDKAGEEAFSIAQSMTDLLGEGPVGAAEESHVVVEKLRTAWALILEKELGGDGERRVALWRLPAGAPHTAKDFISKKYPKSFEVLWNRIDLKPGRHLRLVVGAVASTIEQTGFVDHVPKPTVKEIEPLLGPGEPSADDVLAAVEKFWADRGADARIMINESGGSTRPFSNNAVETDHFVLLHVDRGLYFGTRRPVAKARKSREGKTYPYADANYVYVAAPHTYLTAGDKSFPTAPADHIKKYHVHNTKFKKTLRDEEYGGELDEADKDARAERILKHFEDQFADVPDDNTDTPQQYGPDYMTGLPTHFLPSPMNPDLDAVIFFAKAYGALRYHTIANTAVMFSFLNLAKGGTRLPAELAIIAEMLRVIKDQTMPWPERKSRMDWLATALDNMAIIRSLCGFTEENHTKRHKYWEGLSDGDRQDILKAFCTGEVTGFVRQKLDEALANGEDLLKMRDEGYKANVSEHDRKRIRKNCRLISESYGLSSLQYEEFLEVNKTPCPFHATSHAALERLGYDLDKLSVWIRSSDFYDKCNKNANSHKLYEPELKHHWERLLYDIMHCVSERTRAAIDRVASLRPGLSQSDEDFKGEVKYLILDREDNPISPFVHHPQQLVIATKGPPHTAMLSGYAKREDGRLPTEGPVDHAEPFHPVDSFDRSTQNTSADAGWTNKIMGSWDPSFWRALFALVRQIPFEGPYRKIGEEVGRAPLGQPDAQPSHATAPGPSYRGVEVPEPPIDELLGDEDEPVVFACSACPGTEFTAGAFQEHLNKEHSVWGVECSDCGLKFPDEDVNAAHLAMNNCRGDPEVVVEAAREASAHLPAVFIDNHQEAVHTSAEEKELPTIACECGHYFCKYLSELIKHLASGTHQTRMKADREVEEEDAGFHCPECDQALQTQEGLDAHQASDAHKMTSRCQRQEAGAFRRVTAAEADAPKAETKQTANRAISRRAAEAAVAMRGDGWKKKKYQCKPCKVGTDVKYDFNKHKKSISHLLITDPDYTTESDPSSKARYCSTCNYGTDRKEDWNRHLESKAHKNKVALSSTTTNNSTDTGSPAFIEARAKELPAAVKKRIVARETAPRSEDEGCVYCIVTIPQGYQRELHRKTASCKKTKEILAQIDPDPRQAHLRISQASRAKRPSTNSSAAPTMSGQKRRKSVDGETIPITTGDGVGVGEVQDDGNDEDEDYKDEGDDDDEYMPE